MGQVDNRLFGREGYVVRKGGGWDGSGRLLLGLLGFLGLECSDGGERLLGPLQLVEACVEVEGLGG
jgi:hypothetical protein